MRVRVPKGARFAILATVILLIATACSIQAPDVILNGGGGSGGGTSGLSTGTATGTATGSTSGTSTGLGTTGGTSGTSTGGTTGVNASDTSCAGKATDTGVTGNQITLGSTFAASGPVSSISGPIYYGVRSYFNKVNAAGGVNGRKINFVWYDDGWDAQKGKAFIKKLVEQDHVFFLSVVPSSNGLDAAKTYLEAKRMPVIGSSGLIESQFQSPMQWPVGTSTKSATRIQMLDMKRRGVHSAAIVWLDLLAGQEAFDAFTAGIPKIFGVPTADFMTSSRRVSIDEADYGPVWAQVQADTSNWQKAHGQKVDGRPDFVVFAIDPTSAIKAFQAAQSKGFKPKIGWGGGQPLFLSVVASNGWARSTGLIAGTSYYPPQMAASVPAVRDYVNTVQQYYGSSVDVNNPFLEGGYAGAALTIEAIRRVGSCLTKDKVISVANSFTGYSAAGLTRPLTYTGSSNGSFNHYGNFSYLWVQLSAAGQWQVVTDWVTDPTPGK